MSSAVDAAVLERAAAIITERSTKPDAIATRALVKVLRNEAAKIRREVTGNADVPVTGP